MRVVDSLPEWWSAIEAAVRAKPLIDVAAGGHAGRARCFASPTDSFSELLARHVTGAMSIRGSEPAGMAGRKSFTTA